MGPEAGFAPATGRLILITIAHLSDMHIQKRAEAKYNRNAKVLVEHLVHTLPKSNSYVVMTGDLVDSISREHYENLKRVVLDPLREAKLTILAAPGNHDYAIVGNRFRQWGPELFHEYVERGSYPLVYPPVDRVPPGESVVRFIGLDTADKHEQVFLATGILDDVQFREFSAALETFKNEFLVIFLHHHPFIFNPTKAFRKNRMFLDAVTRRPNVIVLFGHDHRSAAFFGRKGVQLMLASGRVTKPRRDVLAYRLIKLDRNAAGFGTGLNGVSIYTEEIPAAVRRNGPFSRL